MRKSIIRQVLTASLLLSAAPPYLHAQACPDAAKITAGMKGPIATVRFLADDALEGRLAGSPAERCAGDFIAKRFQKLGLKPAGENKTYFQSFALASVVNPHAPTGTGRNVLAWLEGSDPQLKKEFIVVGAHYDHLGMGAFGSTSNEQTPQIHNGADDNASGVAALLDVAERLSKRGRPARSILFVAFTGEEEGLLGSAHFASNPIELAGARGMINMDMVGRLGQGPLIVYGIGTAREWKDLINASASRENVQLTLLDDGYGASDHTSFYLKDIPVLHFFTNVHADYHKPSDDWQKVDAAGLQRVASIVAHVTSTIANKQTTLTLVKGAGKPPGSAGESRGYGAYLGTVPDFSPVPRGVKLSGVRDGSPAHKAGLQAGDVIIRFDDTEIADLQGMTDALRERKPGEVVKVAVLRAGKEVLLTATLGRR